MSAITGSDSERARLASRPWGRHSPESDDARDLPALSVAGQLQLNGAARNVYDPKALETISPPFEAVGIMSSRFSKPPLTTEEILRRLIQQYHMTEAAELIRALT